MNKITKLAIIPGVAGVLLGLSVAILQPTPQNDTSKSTVSQAVARKVTEPIMSTEKEVETVASPVVQDATPEQAPVQEPVLSLQDSIAKISEVIRSTDKATKLSELRYSPNAVEPAIYALYSSNSSVFTEANIHNIATTCADKFISTATTHRESGEPFDFRKFTCTL